MRPFQLIVAVALAAVVCQAAAMGERQPAQVTPTAPAGEARLEPEAMLVKTPIAIRNNRLEAALPEVEKAITSYPNFRLAREQQPVEPDEKAPILGAGKRPLAHSLRGWRLINHA
jgi:hypothetical protein